MEISSAAWAQKKKKQKQQKLHRETLFSLLLVLIGQFVVVIQLLFRMVNCLVAIETQSVR